jgi:hypothetical protein
LEGGSASQKLVVPRKTPQFGTQLPGLATFDAPEKGLKAGPKQSIGIPYFFHPLQLISIPGFSKDLVRSIAALVTVANGSSKIDPDIAPRRVLEALPGTTPDQVRGFMEARDGNSSRDMALPLLGADKASITDTAAPGWRLEITSASAGRILRREIVITVTKGDDCRFVSSTLGTPFYRVSSGT